MQLDKLLLQPDHPKAKNRTLEKKKIDKRGNILTMDLKYITRKMEIKSGKDRGKL